MKRCMTLALLALLAGCGGASSEPKPAGAGAVRDVVVVLKGGEEPLPFDPRGGRLTLVTQEIARLVGHPIVLELDTALSPELRSSLEESVLASFETVARELTLLSKEDPEMFAKARRIERIVCAYDAVAKESEGTVQRDGAVLAVRSPPDRFPLLERWVVTEAVYNAFIGDLDARWGEADPAKLAPRERAPWFGYMAKTRPGYGYLWISTRAKRPGASWDQLRVEHVGRIVDLAKVVDPADPLSRRVRRFLLEHASMLVGVQAERWASSHKADPGVVRRVAGAYESWLNQTVASFDDEERRIAAHALLGPSNGFGSSRDDDRRAAFPGFDRFAFGLSIYDAWVKDGAQTSLPPGPRSELFKDVVCPVKRRSIDDTDAEREIRYGCSAFFELLLDDDTLRGRLADTIAKRRDTRLLETALLNFGTKHAPQALALLDALKEESLFHHGAKVLFHDLARRDDVKSALEKEAPHWWRDVPARRGLSLLVMARQWEHLHEHYGDNQWTRFVAEFGGPVPRDVFAAYLAEGPRAIEMAPKIWPALAKGQDRDELVAKSLTVLLAQDRNARSSRTGPMLVLLRQRLCNEKNAAGLSTIRASLLRWRAEHDSEADVAAVSNALADFTLERCVKAAK
jgi:hypothetical protein